MGCTLTFVDTKSTRKHTRWLQFRIVPPLFFAGERSGSTSASQWEKRASMVVCKRACLHDLFSWISSVWCINDLGCLSLSSLSQISLLGVSRAFFLKKMGLFERPFFFYSHTSGENVCTWSFFFTEYNFVFLFIWKECACGGELSREKRRKSESDRRRERERYENSVSSRREGEPSTHKEERKKARNEKEKRFIKRWWQLFSTKTAMACMPPPFFM